VRIGLGAEREVATYMAEGVTSLVAPLVQGTNILATFLWEDMVWDARIAWPKQAPKPAESVRFRASDEKPLALASRNRTCECFKQVHTGAKCDDSAAMWSITSQNPWCESTYPTNCQKLIECSHMEPSAMVRCPAGTVLDGLGHSCSRPCDKQACPAGEVCEKGGLTGEAMVCR
jgi:hypothetical protein